MRPKQHLIDKQQQKIDDQVMLQSIQNTITQSAIRGPSVKRK
jgi:hypothetical protein